MTRFSKEMSLYLAVNVLKATALAWLILQGFAMISSFYNSFPDIGKQGFTLNYAILVTLFKVPWQLYDFLPAACVIGLLLGLGQLASKSELIAMSSVGVSRLQIGLGALFPAIVLSAVMFFSNETVGTFAEKQALTYNLIKSNKMTVAKYSGVWTKDGDLYFNSRSGTAKGSDHAVWLELADVRLYRFGQGGMLESITHAKSADNKSKKWQLHDVEKTIFTPNAVALEKTPEMPWNTNITDESLEASLVSPSNLTIGELSKNIDYLEQNKLDARKFTTAYWGRWFYPYKVLALSLAVLPFAFSSLRTGGLGKSLFLGIMVGVSGFLMERLMVNLSDVYRIDVRIAYLLAPASVFALCWGYLAKRI